MTPADSTAVICILFSAMSSSWYNLKQLCFLTSSGNRGKKNMFNPSQKKTHLTRFTASYPDLRENWTTEFRPLTNLIDKTPRNRPLYRGVSKNNGFFPQIHPLKIRVFPFFSPSILGYSTPIFVGNTTFWDRHICRLVIRRQPTAYVFFGH